MLLLQISILRLGRKRNWNIRNIPQQLILQIQAPEQINTISVSNRFGAPEPFSL